MNEYFISENIMRICKEKNVTVAEIADALNKSERTVCRYRASASTMKLETLIKLAEILNVELTEFFI